MQTTVLKYLEDFNLYTWQSTILDVVADDGKTSIALDETVFYPQGGGQPYDQGHIKSDHAIFKVNEVRFVDGIVRHIGTFESGSFKVGEKVICEVEQTRRILHTRLHSGGHVVDMAVDALGYTWTPGKGFHFPEGPYVEYTGLLQDSDKEPVRQAIKEMCNKFIQQGHKTHLRFMHKHEMGSVCRFVPDYIPENKPGRVVMYGNFGVPCGGTHVSNLADLDSISIRKIKINGDTIRVSYDVKR